MKKFGGKTEEMQKVEEKEIDESSAEEKKVKKKEERENFRNSTMGCCKDMPLCCLATCCGHLVFANVVNKFLQEFVQTAGMFKYYELRNFD